MTKYKTVYWSSMMTNTGNVEEACMPNKSRNLVPIGQTLCTSVCSSCIKRKIQVTGSLDTLLLVTLYKFQTENEFGQSKFNGLRE